MFKVALIHVDEPDPTPPDWVQERMESRQIEFVYRQCESSLQVVEVGRDADVVWIFGGSTLVTPEVLGELTQCRAILRTGSGTDNVPVEEASTLGILVVNTPLATVDPVSDHTIGLLLSVMRWIPLQDRIMRQGDWQRHARIHEWHLSGQTVGVVGFGRIARAMVKKLGGFDLKFVGFDPHVDASVMADYQVVKSELDDVLRQADIVSMHTPLTKDTQHLIGKREFELMKPTSIFINTARGQVVDEQALIRALSDGQIAAAGLDVFEGKTLDVDSPLRQMDNVVLTPHVAGESDQVYDDFWRYSVAAIHDMAEGYLPASTVNPQVIERSGFARRDTH